MVYYNACEAELDKPMPEQRMHLPLVSVVAVALIDRDKRVLLGKRPAYKAFAGLWEFPGGKIGKGEIPEYALMRECYEELGIETRPGCFMPVTFASHSYEDFHLLMLVYACRTWRGMPKAHAHERLKWVRMADLQAYPMPEADRLLCMRVGEHV